MFNLCWLLPCDLLCILQALQLFFVFSPAYAWTRSLWVLLLLLAAPLAVWMVLLLLTWRSFRAVMGMLRYAALA